MNKISLVSLSEYEIYKNKSKRNLIFGIIFLIISLACFVLSILLSTYESKILWMIFGSFLAIVPLLISLYFFLRRKNELDSAFIYSQLLNENGEEITAQIDDIALETITLQNGFEVYSIKIKYEDNKRNVFVLKDKFDSLSLVINKTYHFCIVSSFVKEISNA